MRTKDQRTHIAPAKCHSRPLDFGARGGAFLGRGTCGSLRRGTSRETAGC